MVRLDHSLSMGGPVDSYLMCAMLKACLNIEIKLLKTKIEWAQMQMSYG